MSYVQHACAGVSPGEEEDGADGGDEVGAGPPLHNSSLCSTRHTQCVHRYTYMLYDVLNICKYCRYKNKKRRSKTVFFLN